MSTYREIVFMIQDELKFVSDDSYYTWEHLKFLVDKFRSFILKKTYTDIKKPIPSSNYQLICLSLDSVDMEDSDPCAEGIALRSTVKIPEFIGVENPKITPMNSFNGNITYVSPERFEHVGFNQFLQNIIYATKGPDSYLYLRSKNPQYKYIENVRLYGVFADTEEASNLECASDGSTINCNILDREFPLEDALVPTLIEMVVKELSGFIYTPKDNNNNASDDLSDLVAFIRRNMKSDLQKQLGNNEIVQ